MKKVILFSLLVVQSLAYGKVYKTNFPISFSVDLRNVLFGKFTYNMGLLVYKNNDNDQINNITAMFQLNKSESSDLYVRNLMDLFEEDITYTQLHSEDGFDSNKEIERVDANEKGRWFMRQLMGRKSAQIIPENGNFSETKALQFVLNQLRGKSGYRHDKAGGFLRFQEGSGDVAEIFYSRDGSHRNEVRVRKIKIKVKISTFLAANTSIEINDGAIEILP
ncbi:MAG: hypothetical protein H6621_12405 [Halobacteriovoraceae bacterium]|nr:hypothetical protein [Halobacteriovoraceae bacterium]